MSYSFYIKTGDRAPSLEAVLRDPDDNPIDLTDADEVRFKMNTSPPMDEVAIVDDATAGLVHYGWKTGETDVAGFFRAEFEITWNDTRKQTVPNKDYIHVYIAEDLDA
jgi:BppU N-terminal domain